MYIYTYVCIHVLTFVSPTEYTAHDSSSRYQHPSDKPQRGKSQRVRMDMDEAREDPAVNQAVAGS